MESRPAPLPSPASGGGAGGEGPRKARKTNQTTLARARKLRASQTDAEQRLWYHLRAHRFLGIKFKRQKPVGPYIVDFIAADHALIIELDGGQHAEQIARDESRTRFLQANGYRVLRFWNDEALMRTQDVLEAIRLALAVAPSSPIPSGHRDH